MPKKKKLAPKAMLKAYQLPEDTVDICLRGDLVAEIRDLDDQLGELESARKRDKRLGDSGPGEDERDIAGRLDDLREQMKAHTLQLHLRAHDRRVWRERVAEYPPRDKRREDQANGVNTDEFYPVVIREAIIEPELDDEDWANLLRITDGEWQKLMNAVFALNRTEVDVPFSLRASRVLETVSADSPLLAPSTPPPAG